MYVPTEIQTPLSCGLKQTVLKDLYCMNELEKGGMQDYQVPVTCSQDLMNGIRFNSLKLMKNFHTNHINGALNCKIINLLF